MLYEIADVSDWNGILNVEALKAIDDLILKRFRVILLTKGIRLEQRSTA